MCSGVVGVCVGERGREEGEAAAAWSTARVGACVFWLLLLPLTRRAGRSRALRTPTLHCARAHNAPKRRLVISVASLPLSTASMIATLELMGMKGSSATRRRSGSSSHAPTIFFGVVFWVFWGARVLVVVVVVSGGEGGGEGGARAAQQRACARPSGGAA